MGETQVTCIQFAPVWGDIEGNIQQIQTLMQKAAGSDLIVLPELASTGYSFANKHEAMQLAESLEESKYIDFLEGMAEILGCYIVSGILEKDGELLYNSAVLISPEGLGGVYRKLHLFDREKEIFEPGDLGMPVYETPIGTIGMLVCYDWMFPEVWRKMTLAGAHIIAHPCNLVLPYCQQVVPAHAMVNRIFIATANRIGTEKELTFTGQSLMVAPDGEIVSRGSATREELLTATLDLRKSLDKQITPRNHALKDRRVELYG